MKPKPKSTWSEIKEFINSKNIGEIITRKELMNKFNNPPQYTIDSYRILLTSSMIGVLESVGNGKYKLLRKIPENTTTTDLQKLLLEGNSWKDWFIPLEDRINYIKKISKQSIRENK